MYRFIQHTPSILRAARIGFTMLSVFSFFGCGPELPMNPCPEDYMAHYILNDGLAGDISADISADITENIKVGANLGDSYEAQVVCLPPGQRCAEGFVQEVQQTYSQGPDGGIEYSSELICMQDPEGE